MQIKKTDLVKSNIKKRITAFQKRTETIHHNIEIGFNELSDFSYKVLLVAERAYVESSENDYAFDGLYKLTKGNPTTKQYSDLNYLECMGMITCYNGGENDEQYYNVTLNHFGTLVLEYYRKIGRTTSL